jgi:3-hydroxyacyl-CoA dehydrogenase / enoyl-CoA hydratase / 3-hydroxybutyryl-CoA epimerase
MASNLPQVTYTLDLQRSIATAVLASDGDNNTVGSAFLASLEEVVARVRRDAPRGLLLVSPKKKSFLEGINPAELRTLTNELSVRAFVRRVQAAFRALADLPLPIAALLDGQCAVGWGFELLLTACDQVFCSPQASLGLPEIAFGLIPSAGGTRGLVRLFGLKAAVDLLVSGKVAPPVADPQLPFTVVPSADLHAAAQNWFESHSPASDVPRVPRLAAKRPDSRSDESAAWPALRAELTARYCKSPLRPYYGALFDAIETGLQADFDVHLARETDLFVKLFFDPYARNKRDQVMLARTAGPTLFRLDLQRVRPVERLAILGAGLMGQGIAQVSIEAGIETVLIDVDQKQLDGALARLRKTFEGQVKKGRMTEPTMAAALQRVSVSSDYATLARANLVIEAVPEDLALQRRVLAQVQAANEQIIFATNTSALPIEDIAAESRRKENVVGMHYFSPVPLMPLLEVVRGADSSAEAVHTAVAVGRRQKKTCVVVRSAPGFYTSRLFGAYVMAGFELAERGADPYEVDRLAVEMGFPRGPFYMFGAVGSLVVLHAGRFMAERMPQRHHLPESVERLIAAGFHGAGKKSFYRDEAGLEPNNEALEHLTRTRAGVVPDRSEIQDVLILSMVAEAFAALGEGVIDDMRVMDLAASLGVAFPDCWHGPARYVSQRGVAATIARLTELHAKFGLALMSPPAILDTFRARGIQTDLI